MTEQKPTVPVNDIEQIQVNVQIPGILIVLINKKKTCVFSWTGNDPTVNRSELNDWLFE